MEVLTGAGLASAAGLNAYLPLLLLGLMARLTDLLALPDGWRWLTDPVALVVLGVLLAVEEVADKVPVVDHVNDVLQTAVRPVSGGVVVGAGTGSAVTVSDPSSWFASGHWVPVVLGALVALGVHLLKATGRGVVNATTAGLGAPVVSTVEDVASFALVLVAVLAPVLVLVVLAALVVAVALLVRRHSRRRVRRAA